MAQAGERADGAAAGLRQDGELLDLQPEDGCEGFAYTSNNGNMCSDPVAQFKEWMVKHDYDPECGKDQPVKV